MFACPTSSKFDGYVDETEKRNIKQIKITSFHQIAKIIVFCMLITSETDNKFSPI